MDIQLIITTRRDSDSVWVEARRFNEMTGREVEFACVRATPNWTDQTYSRLLGELVMALQNVLESRGFVQPFLAP